MRFLREKSRTIMFFATALVITIGVYVTLTIFKKPAEQAEQPTKTIDLVSRVFDGAVPELVSMRITTEESDLFFTKSEDGAGWILPDYADLTLSAYALSDLAETFISLNVDKIAEEFEKADFGLSEPQSVCVAEYSDGSVNKVYLGDINAGQNYYLAFNDNPALYMVTKYVGAKLKASFDFISATSLAAFDVNTLLYMYVNQKGKPVIELITPENGEGLSGFINSMSMISPYPDWEVYEGQLTGGPIKDFSQVTFTSFVEYHPKDLSKYGLDDPSMDIKLINDTMSLHVTIGDAFDDGSGYPTSYCMVEGYPFVYTIRDYVFKMFYDLDVFTFLTRNILLEFITNVDHMTMTYLGNVYDMELVHEYVPDEENGGEVHVLHPSINGTAVNQSAFRSFYTAFLSVRYDAEMKDALDTEVVVLSFDLTFVNDKEPLSIKFYDYSDSFYAVQKNDNPAQFIIGKTNVKLFIDVFNKMMAGELDEED